MKVRAGVMSVGVVLAGLMVAGAGAVDPNSRLPQPMKPIEAVEVDREFRVVTGTVTVRARGVLVSPSDVTYSLQPDFRNSSGYLFPVAEGVYRLEIERVPADRAFVLTIRSTHNDTVLRNGLVEHLGQTYTGSLRIDIPHGRDYSIGDQLLDLR